MIQHLLKGKLDQNGKFIIPADQRHINIDVGLAGDACHSAIWLSKNSDRFVIGIEPLELHWGMLENIETSESKTGYPQGSRYLQLEEGVVKLENKVVCNIGDRFCGIRCAIDDVSQPSWEHFYLMDPTDGASGSSSLLKPTDKHPHFVEDVIKTPVISLEMVLGCVDWGRIPFIEHIKTDCEGNDLDVIKSIGKYLDRVMFITTECSATNVGHWENQYTAPGLLHFMTSKGFVLVHVEGADAIFANKRSLDDMSAETRRTVGAHILNETTRNIISVVCNI